MHNSPSQPFNDDQARFILNLPGTGSVIRTHDLSMINERVTTDGDCVTEVDKMFQFVFELSITCSPRTGALRKLNRNVIKRPHK